MPVLDPMQLAREACARIADANGEHLTAEGYRKGQYDGNGYMRRAIGAAELAMAAAALVVDREAAEYERIFAEGTRQIPPCGAERVAHERSQDRRAARARATRQAAAVIRGEFEGWSTAWDDPQVANLQVGRPLAGVDVLSGEAPAQ